MSGLGGDGQLQRRINASLALRDRAPKSMPGQSGTASQNGALHQLVLVWYWYNMGSVFVDLSSRIALHCWRSNAGGRHWL
jgi:hypothetical protein